MADPNPFVSVSPLPHTVRNALVAMASIGMTSLLTTALLLVQITYNLVLWKLRDNRRQKEQLEQQQQRTVDVRPSPEVDLQLGLTEEQYYQARRKKGGGNGADISEQQQQQQGSYQPELHAVETTTSRGPADESAATAGTAAQQPRAARREKPPNPLLLLIYNLLLADVTLSAMYINDLVWLHMDAIVAPSTACSVQGWIVSFGCLTTSGFLFAISVFSYMGIIRGYKATQRDVLIACCTIWTLSVVLSSIGPIYYRNQNTYYGRQTCWCWVSEQHKNWRLTVYLWGFPSLTGAVCIYGLTFYKLWQEGRSSRFMPRRARAGSTTTSLSTTSNTNTYCAENNTNINSTPLRPSGHHPAFLIYPCIYLVTGTPLMLGSLIPSLERNPTFMGAAGALLASTGLLDTILWSSIVLFSGREDLRNTGLDQFTFMRTPEGRTLGNIVFVQGGDGSKGRARGEGGAAVEGLRHHHHHHHHHHNRASWHSKKKEKGWWRLGDRLGEQGSLSQEQLPRVNDGIQMEVVTTVVVEVGPLGGQQQQQHSRNYSRDGGKSLDSI